MEKNEHGHDVFTIVGKNMTGKQEVNQLMEAGFLVSHTAQACLCSDEYKRNHRLRNGKKYQIVLIRGRELGLSTSHTYEAIQKYAEKFGYQKPRAGILPRIRKAVTRTIMEEMQISDIVALHKPIKDLHKDPYVLSIFQSPGNGSVSVYWDNPGIGWNYGATFAFIQKT